MVVAVWESFRHRYFDFAHPPDELVLESGEKLGPITVLMRHMATE